MVFRIWIALATVSLGVLLLGEVLLQNSRLVRGIKSGEKLLRPFPEFARVDTLKEQVVTPTRADYLIGTRFHSPSLLMANKLLHYHPQNRVFQNHLQTFQGIQNYPQPLRDQLVAKLESRFHDTRFLIQSPYTGNFTVLSRDRAKIFLRRAVATSSKPLLQELEESINYMVSGIRFESKERETAMALITTKVLDDFLGRLFSDNERKSVSPSNSPRASTFHLMKFVENPTVAMKRQLTRRSWLQPPQLSEDLEVAVTLRPKPRKKTRKPPPVKRKERRNRQTKSV